jgi:hypothetical protein
MSVLFALGSWSRSQSFGRGIVKRKGELRSYDIHHTCLAGLPRLLGFKLYTCWFMVV